MNYLRKIEEYQNYLNLALERLFKDKDLSGYWYKEDGRIIKKLDYFEKNWSVWKPDIILEYRYGPFALFGSLYWRLYFKDSTDKYDNKMVQYLNFLSEKISGTGQIINDFSGWDHALILICLSLGIVNFEKKYPLRIKLWFDKADFLFRYCINRWKPENIEDNHDTFLLWAYIFYYQALNITGFKEKAWSTIQTAEIFADSLCKVQDKNGIFQTGDPRACYHQRIIYPLLGLGRTTSNIKNKNKKGWYLATIERSLSFILRKRKSLDGAFIWHNLFCRYKPKSKFKWPWHYAPNGRGYLFACHQTFFVNAVEQYYLGGGTKNYLDEEIVAMNWIYGVNRKRENLVKASGLGIPLRMMDSKGNFNVNDQNFKGAYEVGSYIIALTDFIKTLKSKK